MKKRVVCRIVLFCMALLMLLYKTGIAEKEEPILKVSVQADKQEYKANETAKLTITVENTSDRIATDVNIENLLPNGLVYGPQKTTGVFKHAEIQPHTSVQHEVYVQVVDVKLPQTGDNSPNILILICIAFAGIAALIVLLKRTTGLYKGR